MCDYSTHYQCPTSPSHPNLPCMSRNLVQSVSACAGDNNCEITLHERTRSYDEATSFHPPVIQWHHKSSLSSCSVSSSSETSDGESVMMHELALDVTMTPFTVAIDSLIDPTESYETASDSDFSAHSTPIHSPPPQKLDIEVSMLYARSDSTCDYNDSLPNSPQTIYSSPSSLAVSSIQLHVAQSMRTYEEFCEGILAVYCWQRPITNEAYYGPFHTSFQKEVMNNPYFSLTPVDFNDILKKCQFIRSRWIGDKIRSTRPGKMGKVSWNRGEKITELDLFAIKLYTDFEVCQRELKKCYRPPVNHNGNTFAMCAYEERLCYFSHWRRLLTVAIAKYGTLLKYRVFYHGINKIMKLDIHPTKRCHGPFSATPDVEIARGFATKDGVILKMMSKFPRLDTDYFFNASEISAYPDEKEYLIGCMYTRILCVQLGCSELTINDLSPSQLDQFNCFIISSLIKHDLYCYGPYLEILFDALLMTDERYGTDYLSTKTFWRTQPHGFHPSDDLRNDVGRISRMIPSIVRSAFKSMRYKKRVLKLDQISDGMRPLFYDATSGQLSMSKVTKFAPNIGQLHLYEEYEINNDFVTDLLQSNSNIDTIKVFKYAFDGSSDQFEFKKCLSPRHVMELQKRAWYIYEDRDVDSYKCILTKKQRPY
eukprot:122665_1